MAPRGSLAQPSASPLLATLRHGRHLKGNSLLMTLFGDAFARPQQAVWLGTLIELAGQLGLTSRLVRTSIYRLVDDDWLLASRLGRRSYYRLSANGLRRVQQASQRIYTHNADTPETEPWTLLTLSPALKASARQQLRRELRWNGYGQLADGVYARIGADRAGLHEVLSANGAVHHAWVWQAQAPASPLSPLLHALQHDGCCSDRLECAWRGFIDRFTPLVAPPTDLTPGEAFLARTLLVHEFRRVLLRAPVLPRAIESGEAASEQARRLFHWSYRQLQAPSEAYLRQTLLRAPQEVTAAASVSH